MSRLGYFALLLGSFWAGVISMKHTHPINIQLDPSIAVEAIIGFAETLENSFPPSDLQQSTESLEE